MQSLQMFSSAALVAHSIYESDLQIELSIGSNYAKSLNTFIHENFDSINDFVLSKNGLLRSIMLMTSSGIKTIELHEDTAFGNKVVFHDNNMIIERSYESIKTFNNAITEIHNELCLTITDLRQQK